MTNDLISRKALLDDMGLDVGDEYGVTWTTEQVREFIVRQPAAQPENRVLTLNEMESSDDPVWLERKGNTHIVVTDTCIGGLWRDGRCVCHAYTIGRREAWCFYEDEYMQEWRCWLHNPTDDERINTPWEVSK